MTSLPAEPKLDYDALKPRAEELWKRFSGTRGLHERVKWRQKHLFLDPGVDPVMPGSEKNTDGSFTDGPWQHAAEQTVRLEQTYQRLKSRVCENEWKTECEPVKDTIEGKAKANEAEAVLGQGFDFIREKTGNDLQASLCDGLGYEAAGVLHWRIDDSGYRGGMPDYEVRENLDEYDDADDDDEDTKKRKGRERSRYEESEKGYRETENSLKDRIARYKAECGFPVFVDTPSVEMCAWTQDKSTFSEFKDFMVKRIVPSLGEWKLAKRDDFKLRERDAPGTVQINAIDDWTPSLVDYEHKAVVVEYWTRRHWYEWCEDGGDGEAGKIPYFDSGEHWYGQPPFALATGRIRKNADPAWMYLPAMHAMLEEKPGFDRRRSLLNAGVEAASIQKWFLKRDKNAGNSTFQDGQSAIDMSPDADEAGTIPDGYDLVARGGEGVNQQLFKTYEYSLQDLKDSEPGTGFATFGESTQPWSARQERDQENMEPKQYLRSIRRAIQAMVNNLIKCFSDEEHGPGEVFGYAKTDSGALDRSKVLSIKPKEWEGIIADVSIQEVGGIERNSLIETNLILLDKGAITMLDLYDAMGIENPEEKYAQTKVFFMWESEILPGMLRQAAAEYLGPQFAISPDGVPVGPDGRAVSDEEAIRANGGTPMQQGQQMQGQQSMAPPSAPTGQPGPMPTLAAPGTAPIRGMM